MELIFDFRLMRLVAFNWRKRLKLQSHSMMTWQALKVVGAASAKLFYRKWSWLAVSWKPNALKSLPLSTFFSIFHLFTHFNVDWGLFFFSQLQSLVCTFFFFLLEISGNYFSLSSPGSISSTSPSSQFILALISNIAGRLRRAKKTQLRLKRQPRLFSGFILAWLMKVLGITVLY